MAKAIKLYFLTAVFTLAANAVAQTPVEAAKTPASHVVSIADAAKSPATGTSNRFSPTSFEYTLGEGDLLSINVWHETEISRILPVRPDGKISLPLVGDIVAKDKTVLQLQDAITKELGKLIENPQVTVMVQEARSKRFNVVGEVIRPGPFVLNQPTGVLDAIALAGGFRDFAKRSKVYVLRSRADGTRMRIPFDYNKVVKGEDPNQDVMLEPGDTVVVP